MTISYFEDIEKHIMSRLNSSQSSIFVAVAWFTNQLLFDSLMDALKKNIAVKILILDDILNRNEFGLDFGVLSKLGAEVRFAKSDKGTMHNKFCIIDDLIMTGSYNWTYHANNNSENILMTDEESVLNSYREEFDKLFSIATPIPQPYEYLKWTDVKEGDFSELRRNIYKDVVAKKDENCIIRENNLIELSKAFKTNDRKKISLASTLPIYDEYMTLKDVLINNPNQYELKLWTENKCPQIIDNCLNGFLRKWIYLPHKYMNGTIEGELIPYTFIDDIGGGIPLSINNLMFLKTIEKFINLNEINDDSYKYIPESIICIENVNMFHYQFEKPMFNIKHSSFYRSWNKRYVYSIDVLGIAKDLDAEPIADDDSIDFERFYLGYTNSLGRFKIDKERIAFFDGWNPVERGTIIQKRFFTF